MKKNVVNVFLGLSLLLPLCAVGNEPVITRKNKVYHNLIADNATVRNNLLVYGDEEIIGNLDITGNLSVSGTSSGIVLPALGTGVILSNSGVLSTAAGIAGQVLASNGAGALPTFQSLASLGNILQGGNAFNTAMIIGETDNFGFNVITNNLTRFQISNTGAATINAPTSGVGLTIAGGGLSSVGTATINGGVVNLGTDNAANAINIGLGTTARAIHIGDSAAANVITIGSTTGAAGITESVGTGNYVLNGAAGSTVTIGAGITTGTILIGGTTETGTITVGSSSGTNTVNIGTGAGATAVNIGSVGSGSVITIGNTSGASGIIQNVGTGNYVLNGAAGSKVTIGAGITGATSGAGVYVNAVNGVTVTGGIAVLINPTNGQLGTVASARRYKENIVSMEDVTSTFMKLNPVMFNYKKQSVNDVEYGLIAEEVAELYPHLVVCNSEGQIETIRYHLLYALLIKVIQENRKITDQNTELIKKLCVVCNL